MEKSDRINNLKAKLFSRQYDQHHTRELNEKGKDKQQEYQDMKAVQSRQAWR